MNGIKNKTFSVAIASALALLAAGCGGAEAARPAEQTQLGPGLRQIPVSKVGADYGPLVITAAEFESAARGDLLAWADHKPWSAWWLPMSEDYLFAKPESPLGKYDAYSAKRGRLTQAAKTEKNLPMRRTAGADWAGYCHAWAMASLLEPEPVAHDVDGIHFTVGDLKSILIKSYDGYTGAVRYGEPTVDDVSPRDFHQLVQANLLRDRKGFVMDFDGSDAIWNVPIYGAQVTRMERDPVREGVVRVTLSVLAASSQVYRREGAKTVPDHEFVGTSPMNVIYTYELSGEWNARGDFHAEAGAWTGRSAADHPDFMLVLQPGGKRRSDNDQILPEWVDELLAGRM